MGRIILSSAARTANLFRPRATWTAPFSQKPSAVPLQYDKLVPENGNETDKPLVILHGLFGTKRNWLSLSKAFQRDLDRPIYSLDLRNHGTSPHASPMNYSAMAEDVLNFCSEHSLRHISLLGHSMGGKVVMSLALNADIPKDLLAQLIVADIAPSRGALSPEFQSYVKAMKRIEEEGVASRKDAQHILAEYEQDAMTRAFLLTNMVEQDGTMKFRIPLDIIGDAISEIGSFPYEPGERTWEGPTLFIKGTQSKYLNDHNIPIAKQFFPNMQMVVLPTGHWVHAEKPNEFKKAVTDFIKSH